jgi:hypothetical protein
LLKFASSPSLYMSCLQPPPSTTTTILGDLPAGFRQKHPSFLGDLINTFGSAVEVLRNQHIQNSIKQKIKAAGGIFIGREELIKLGKLSRDAKLPAIPEEFSRKFLSSAHPLREGTIASHIILAFDPESQCWYAIDRGQGAQSDLAPGTLGRKGPEQIIQTQINGQSPSLNGLELSPPLQYEPYQRSIQNAVELHLKNSQPLHEAPFFRCFGRTNHKFTYYPENNYKEGREHSILIGNFPIRLESGETAPSIAVHFGTPTESDHGNVGLILCWVKPEVKDLSTSKQA